MKEEPEKYEKYDTAMYSSAITENLKKENKPQDQRYNKNHNKYFDQQRQLKTQ